MQTMVYDILRKYGLVQVFETSPEFHLRLELPPYLPLVIERVGEIISVAHYGELNGDLMRDPELTYLWGTWAVLSITQDYVGHYAEVYGEVDGHPEVNIALFNDLIGFSAMWAKNIRDQGWLSNDVKPVSNTHMELLVGRQGGSEGLGGANSLGSAPST